MQCAFAHKNPTKSKKTEITDNNILLFLECPYGKITNIVPGVGIGINSYTNPIRDACVVNETLYNNARCSSAVDKDYINEHFDTKCAG